MLRTFWRRSAGGRARFGGDGSFQGPEPGLTGKGVWWVARLGAGRVLVPAVGLAGAVPVAVKKLQHQVGPDGVCLLPALDHRAAVGAGPDEHHEAAVDAQVGRVGAVAVAQIGEIGADRFDRGIPVALGLVVDRPAQRGCRARRSRRAASAGECRSGRRDPTTRRLPRRSSRTRARERGCEPSSASPSHRNRGSAGSG